MFANRSAFRGMRVRIGGLARAFASHKRGCPTLFAFCGGWPTRHNKGCPTRRGFGRVGTANWLRQSLQQAR